MSTAAATIAHILDTLAPLPLSSRKMFGEYALYLDGKTVAFVCDDTLFIKPPPAQTRFCPMPSAARHIPAAKTISSAPKASTIPICAAASCAPSPPTRPRQNRKSRRILKTARRPTVPRPA